MTERKFSLRLINGGASDITPPSPPQANYGSVQNILLRVLKARLKPDLTVEEACHLWAYNFDEPNPRMAHLHEDLDELHKAGLEARVQLGAIPEGIILTDAAAFTRRFPELAAAVPVLLAHQGVQPFTNGSPRQWKR